MRAYKQISLAINVVKYKDQPGTVLAEGLLHREGLP